MYAGFVRATEYNPDPLQKFDTQIKKVGIRLLNTMSKIARVMLSEFRLLELSCFSAWAFTPQKPTKEQTLQERKIHSWKQFSPPFLHLLLSGDAMFVEILSLFVPKKSRQRQTRMGGGRPKQQEVFPSSWRFVWDNGIGLFLLFLSLPLTPFPLSFLFLSGLVVLLNGTGSGLALGMGFAKWHSLRTGHVELAKWMSKLEKFRQWNWWFANRERCLVCLSRIRQEKNYPDDDDAGWLPCLCTAEKKGRLGAHSESQGVEKWGKCHCYYCLAQQK